MDGMALQTNGLPGYPPFGHYLASSHRHFFLPQAGPNWKSLSAPAILPISVDYFPPQTKIDLNFTISQYSINISDFEHHNFSSTKLLLLEMVRQRITQDFQLV